MCSLLPGIALVKTVRSTERRCVSQRLLNPLRASGGLTPAAMNSAITRTEEIPLLMTCDAHRIAVKSRNRENKLPDV
jgi:hypothetical protein